MDETCGMCARSTQEMEEMKDMLREVKLALDKDVVSSARWKRDSEFIEAAREQENEYNKKCISLLKTQVDMAVQEKVIAHSAFKMQHTESLRLSKKPAGLETAQIVDRNEIAILKETVAHQQVQINGLLQAVQQMQQAQNQ